MKKQILVFFLLLPISFAAPVISDFNQYPEILWLGDTAKISFNCFEENYSIESVKASVTTPIMIPNLNILKDVAYNISIPLNYPYAGNYTLRIECESNNTINNYTVYDYKFAVYNLTSTIDSVIPDKIYSGDEVKIYMKIKRNSEILDGTYPISFTVYLNNSIVNTTMPTYYDPSRGWVISFIAFEGKYNMKVEYSIFGKNFFVERELNVNKPVSFSLVSIDKTDVLVNDIVYLKFLATERDSKIDKDEYNIRFDIDSTQIIPENISISESPSNTIIESRLKMPSLDKGEHNLKITFNYKNHTFILNKKLDFQFEILGKISNDNGDYFNAKVKFKNGTFEKTFTTNSSGYFYGNLPKAKYDIEVEIKDYPNYPGVKLILNKTELESFDDSIKFDLIQPKYNGLSVAGSYMIDTSLSFDKAHVEMIYDKKKISNPDELVVYRCEKWDYRNGMCSDEMEEIDFSVNKNKNSVDFDIQSFSYFLIAYKKKLNTKFSFDKTSYYIKEPIKINGYVEDNDGNPVSDTDVEIRIISTGEKYNAKTDKNGVFNIEFLSPSNEGIFSIEINSKKDFFIEDKKQSSINVTKSKKLSLLMDDSFKVYRGENITIPVKIINIGQSDLKAKIKLTGINENEYVISVPNEFDIASNEEKNFELKIFALSNVSNLAPKIIVEYSGLTEQKQFVVIFEDKPVAQNDRKFNLHSAKVILPESTDIIFTVIVCCAILLTAYIFKRMKTPKKNNMDLLIGIKSEINK
ncbi:MAG: carboxypeptidase-like regulatory domain-containing protein [Candidatus Aenigmatarchaeota archaeon]|nr:carboxypeptidase-like regulatory domain-containing protein [Candidatus Aenigmarchaeota archaeon]